jgi:hypothetical protein
MWNCHSQRVAWSFFEETVKRMQEFWGQKKVQERQTVLVF